MSIRIERLRKLNEEANNKVMKKKNINEATPEYLKASPYLKNKQSIIKALANRLNTDPSEWDGDLYSLDDEDGEYYIIDKDDGYESYIVTDKYNAYNLARQRRLQQFTEDEGIESLTDDFIEYLINDYGGPRTVLKALNDSGLITDEDIAEELIKKEGPGPTLATDDEKELYLGRGLYAYKQS